MNRWPRQTNSLPASQVTGLSDFGPDDYTDGFEVLLGSLERDADLTPRGRKVMRAMVRGALAARLCSEAGWPTTRRTRGCRSSDRCSSPGSRSGTTAVQRLLHAVPDAQGLEMWLTEVPQPRPPRETWAYDPVHAILEAGCERHHEEHPEYVGMH